MSGPATRVHDRNVLDILESIGAQPLDAQAWRITREGRDATKGSTAGGRWSPTGEFEVLYTSSEKDGALAEIGHRLSLEPVWPSKLFHELHELRIRVERALHLPDFTILQHLGVNTERYESYEYGATQAIAAAARFLGYEALIAPNARHPSLNLVVLTENLEPTALLEVISTERVDWSAWRRQSRTRRQSAQDRRPKQIGSRLRQNAKRQLARSAAHGAHIHRGALRRSRKSPIRSSAR